METVIAAPGELDWFATLPGEDVAIHIPGDRVGGQFSVIESIAAPGAGAPPHIHLGSDECFFIQRGRDAFHVRRLEFVLEVTVKEDRTHGVSLLFDPGTSLEERVLSEQFRY